MKLLQRCHYASLLFPISGIVNCSISLFIKCFAHKDHSLQFAHLSAFHLHVYTRYRTGRGMLYYGQKNAIYLLLLNKK